MARRATKLPRQSEFPAVTANGYRAPCRVLVGLFDDALASRVRGYLARSAEFELVDPGGGNHPPDVVIVDFAVETGLTAVHGEREARPIALASDCGDSVLLHALQAGAWALLPARPSPFELLATVRQVAAGGCPILAEASRRPGIAATTLTRLRMTAARRSNPLSAREAAILAQVAQGAKNGVIGAILGLREQTVKNYLSGILKKTQTGNRAEAAAVALKNGWLSD